MTYLLPVLLLLGLLVSIGVVLSLTLMQVRRQRLHLERRMGLLGGFKGRRGPAAEVGLESDEPGWLTVGRHARGFFAAGLPRGWGMTAGAITLSLTSIGGAAVGWLICRYGIGTSGLVALAISAAMAFWAPRALLKHQQNGEDKRFMEVFPDTIDMVIRMLRAGLPITTAVRAVGKEASPPVNAVFTNLADKMAIGISFEDALAAAGKRIALTDFRFFAVAISLQRETGGNLAATLDILSDLMRKRRAARLKARATTGEVRMSALVLGGIPFFIIGGLLVMTPAYLQPLIADPRGHVIVAVASGSMLTGFAIIRQMMRSVTGAT